jgi:hypothetical protein
LHSSKLTHCKKQSYPLTRTKATRDKNEFFRLTTELFAFILQSTFYCGQQPSERSSPMTAHQINRFSAKVIIVLSVLALLTVLSGYTHPPQAPETDEGAAAHIFQLSIAAVALSILVFLSTADWKQPSRSVRPLAFPAAALVLAFGALYYLEHFRYIAAH